MIGWNPFGIQERCQGCEPVVSLRSPPAISFNPFGVG